MLLVLVLRTGGRRYGDKAQSKNRTAKRTQDTTAMIKTGLCNPMLANDDHDVNRMDTLDKKNTPGGETAIF